MFRRALAALFIGTFAVLGTSAMAQDNPSYNLVNNSGRVIETFRTSPVSDNEWGEDRLGSRVLASGQRFAVRLPRGECEYDIRVTFQGGGRYERREVNVCETADVVIGPDDIIEPQQGSPSLRIRNTSRQAINEVYATTTDVDNWGNDRLGRSVLAAGQSRTFSLPQGSCEYDIRVVFADGSDTERREVDLCNNSEQTFREGN